MTKTVTGEVTALLLVLALMAPLHSIAQEPTPSEDETPRAAGREDCPADSFNAEETLREVLTGDAPYGDHPALREQSQKWSEHAGGWLSKVGLAGVDPGKLALIRDPLVCQRIWRVLGARGYQDDPHRVTTFFEIEGRYIVTRYLRPLCCSGWHLAGVFDENLEMVGPWLAH